MHKSYIPKEPKLIVAMRHCSNVAEVLAAVKKLIQDGASIEEADQNGSTPLLKGIEFDWGEELAEFLVGLGANINVTNRQGETPLIYAAEKRQGKLIRFLVLHGANPNLGTHSETPFIIVYKARRYDLAFFLADHGAELTHVNEKIFKDMRIRYDKFFSYIEKNDYAKVVAYLKKYTFLQVDTMDQNGNTPLMLADQTKYLKLATHFVLKGARLDGLPPESYAYYEKIRNAFNAFWPAITANDLIKIKEAIVLIPEIVNSATSRKKTALMAAACQGDLECTQWLVAQGAKVNALDESGNSALVLALQDEEKNSASIAYLIAQGANLTIKNCGQQALQKALEANYFARIRYWLSCGLEPSWSISKLPRKLVGPIFYAACVAGVLDVIKNLITTFGYHLLYIVDDQGMTPLILVSQKPDVQAVDYLMCVGAEVHIPSLPALISDSSEINQHLAQFIEQQNALYQAVDAETLTLAQAQKFYAQYRRGILVKNAQQQTLFDYLERKSDEESKKVRAFIEGIQHPAQIVIKNYDLLTLIAQFCTIEDFAALTEAIGSQIAAQAFIDCFRRIAEPRSRSVGAASQTKNDAMLTFAYEHHYQQLFFNLLRLGLKGSANYTSEMYQQGHLRVLKFLIYYGSEIPIKKMSSQKVSTFNNSTQNKQCRDFVRSLEDEAIKFLKAAKMGDCEAMQPFLTRYTHGNTIITNGYALKLATLSGALPAVRLLIEHGANIKIKDKEGSNLLMFAANRGFEEIFTYLTEQGLAIDVTATNKNGDSMLVLAIGGGCLEIVRQIILAGADVNACDGSGNSPLMIAAKNGLLDISIRLIAAGADVNVKNELGDSPLIFAAAEGHLSVVTALVDAGADINACDESGNSSLMIAAEKGLLDISIYLIAAGVDVNAKNALGNAPLILAATAGHLPVVAALVDARADVYMSNEAGASVLLSAGKNKHCAVVDYFLEKYISSLDYRKNALFDLSNLGMREKLVRVVTAGVDPEIKNHHGKTALLVAASYGHLDILKFLHRHGFNLFAQDDRGNTALILALRYGHKKTARYVIKKAPALVGVINQQSQSALFFATQNFDTKMVEFLLKNNADPNQINGDSGHVLTFFCDKSGSRDGTTKKRCLATIKTLFNYGASLDCVPDKPSQHQATEADYYSDDLDEKFKYCYDQEDYYYPSEYEDESDTIETSLLVRSVKNKDVALLELLLTVGKGCVEATDKAGNTLLVIAVLSCYIAVIECLLRHQANIAVKNARGENLSDIAKAIALNPRNIEESIKIDSPRNRYTRVNYQTAHYSDFAKIDPCLYFLKEQKIISSSIFQNIARKRKDLLDRQKSHILELDRNYVRNNSPDDFERDDEEEEDFDYAAEGWCDYKPGF